MEFRWLLSFALLGLLAWSGSAETVIKVLHIQKLPKVLGIWKEAAQEFEKLRPGVKVQFDYLENEAFIEELFREHFRNFLAARIDQEVGQRTSSRSKPDRPMASRHFSFAP